MFSGITNRQKDVAYQILEAHLPIAECTKLLRSIDWRTRQEREAEMPRLNKEIEVGRMLGLFSGGSR